MVKPAANSETWKCSAIEGRHPLGEEDAKVAFMTSRTAHTVIWVRRAVVQLCGFSISSGAKSTWPLALMKGGFSWERSFVRYGLLTAEENIRCRLAAILGGIFP